MLKSNTLDSCAKLSDVIKKFNNIKKKIILVTKKNKLHGVITDGDIRRFFLKNQSIDIEVTKLMNPSPKFIYEGEKLSTYPSNIQYLPVINKKKKIIKIIDLRKINKKIDNIEIVIIAGGKGKRLGKITKKIPKPMIKINQKPHLEELINTLINQGFKNFTLNLNYKHKYIINYLNKKFKNIKLNFNVENKVLGTAGSLFYLKNTSKHLLVINADLITNLDLNNLIDYHMKNNNDLTISIKKTLNTLPYAEVKIRNLKLVSIEEKPSREYFFNTGIYIIKPKTVTFLKEKKIDMPELISKCIKLKKRVMPFYMYENWIDFGNQNTLIHLNKKFKRQL